MFRAWGTPGHLRRPGADKILALRARRQTAGSDLQLARLQSEQLSKNQTGPAKEISWFCLGVSEACRRPEVRGRRPDAGPTSDLRSPTSDLFGSLQELPPNLGTSSGRAQERSERPGKHRENR